MRRHCQLRHLTSLGSPSQDFLWDQTQRFPVEKYRNPRRKDIRSADWIPNKRMWLIPRRGTDTRSTSCSLLLDTRYLSMDTAEHHPQRNLAQCSIDHTTPPATLTHSFLDILLTLYLPTQVFETQEGTLYEIPLRPITCMGKYSNKI